MGWFTSDDSNKNTNSSTNTNNNNSNSSSNYSSFNSFSFGQQRSEVMCKNDPDDQKMSICVQKTYTTSTGPDGKKKQNVNERTFKRENGLHTLPAMFPSNIFSFTMNQLFGDATKQIDQFFNQIKNQQFVLPGIHPYNPTTPVQFDLPKQYQSESRSNNGKVYDL